MENNSLVAGVYKYGRHRVVAELEVHDNDCTTWWINVYDDSNKSIHVASASWECITVVGFFDDIPEEHEFNEWILGRGREYWDKWLGKMEGKFCELEEEFCV